MHDRVGQSRSLVKGYLSNFEGMIHDYLFNIAFLVPKNVVLTNEAIRLANEVRRTVLQAYSSK